jgi:MFS family permease
MGGSSELLLLPLSPAPPSGAASPSSQSLRSLRRALCGRAVLVVFLGLLSDYLLLTIIFPYVPQLLTHARADGGLGRYSTTAIGALFAAKPVVQILCNPLAGVLSERHGPRRPLAASLLALACSALGFGAASTYAGLVAARAAQGAASAVTMTAGMSLLCELHTTKAARAEAMGNAMGGLALGVLGGPLLGGVLYTHCGGQAAPMYFIAGVLVLAAAAQLNMASLERRIGEAAAAAGAAGAGAADATGAVAFADGAAARGGYGSERRTQQQQAHQQQLQQQQQQQQQDDEEEEQEQEQQEEEHTPLMAVFGDPLFLTVGLTLVAANAVIGMLEPLFQLWAAAQFDLGADGRGLLWSATTLGYLLGTPLTGALAASARFADGKRRLMAGGLALMAAALPLFAAAPASWPRGAALALAAGALALVGLGMALVDVPAQPLLADVADYRGLPGYGVAFSLSDVAASVGFVVGPLLGGAIADHRGTSASSSVSGMEGACLVFAVVALLVAPAVAVVLARAERGTSEKGRGDGGGDGGGDDGARKKEQKLNSQQQFA